SKQSLLVAQTEVHDAPVLSPDVHAKRASRMPSSYSRIIGSATMLWLIGSGVGVTTAAMTNAATMAKRRYALSFWTLTTLSLARKKMTRCVSKVSPQKSTDETKLI